MVKKYSASHIIARDMFIDEVEEKIDDKIWEELMEKYGKK